MRELVYRAIRRVGRAARQRARGDARAGRGRCASIAFDGTPHGPALRGARRSGRAGVADCRRGSRRELSPLVDARRMAGLARARAARPAGQCRARPTRDDMASAFDGAEPTRLSPWGLRLPADTRVDDRPEFADGLVEVQDEGSQLIALACDRRGDGHDPRPVRRGGGQGAGARRRRAGRDDHRLRHQSRSGCRSLRRAPRAPGRRSSRACSMAGGRRSSSPTSTGRPTSCWSMRRAAGRGRGGATPKGAGG